MRKPTSEHTCIDDMISPTHCLVRVLLLCQRREVGRIRLYLEHTEVAVVAFAGRAELAVEQPGGLLGVRVLFRLEEEPPVHADICAPIDVDVMW